METDLHIYQLLDLPNCFTQIRLRCLLGRTCTEGKGQWLLQTAGKFRSDPIKGILRTLKYSKSVGILEMNNQDFGELPPLVSPLFKSYKKTIVINFIKVSGDKYLYLGLTPILM